MATLVDGFGRTFPYLRLSLTEACNYRCSYCLPDGYQADGRPTFLSLDEITRLVRGFAAVGMRKIRLTGGEPSLRKDLPSIIAAVSATPGVQKIALTTNGCLLPRHVGIWRDAGLTALNVSLDSLNPARFKTITGHDRFAEVTEGVEMALGLGFAAVKLNAVLLRGLNDDELPAWYDYLRERNIAIRFIELMRTGDNQAYFERHHYRAEALEQQLVDAGWTQQARAPDAGPAREYAHPDYRGRIGIIAPYSKDFCASCNRLRLSSDGKLHLCLFGDGGVDLRELLAQDAQQQALEDRIAEALTHKKQTHFLHQGNTGITQNLSYIGG